MSTTDRIQERLRSRVAGPDWQNAISADRYETESERLRRAVAFGYGRRDYVIRRLLAVADSISVVIALIATVIISPRVTSQDHLLLGLATVPVWFTILTAYGLYNRDIKRISHSTVDDLPWIMHAMLVGCLLTWLYFKALPVPKLEFPDILMLATIASVSIVALRSLTRRLATYVLGSERVLFVGEGQPADILVRKMSAHPEYGLEPVGIVPFPPRSAPDRLHGQLNLIRRRTPAASRSSRHGVRRSRRSQTGGQPSERASRSAPNAGSRKKGYCGDRASITKSAKKERRS